VFQVFTIFIYNKITLLASEKIKKSSLRLVLLSDPSALGLATMPNPSYLGLTTTPDPRDLGLTTTPDLNTLGLACYLTQGY